MVFAPAPGVLQVEQKFDSNGSFAENVFHVAHTDGSAWTSSQIAAMLQVFNDWEQASGRQCRNTHTVCIAYHARDLTADPGQEADKDGNSSGTVGGTAPPNNVTFALKKSTGLSGRGNRGRVYCVGLSESDIVGDTYSGTAINRWEAAYAALLAVVSAVTNCKLVILQSRSGGVALDPRTSRAITSFTNADEFLDSQRRRLANRGL